MRQQAAAEQTQAKNTRHTPHENITQAYNTNSDPSTHKNKKYELAIWNYYFDPPRIWPRSQQM
jgi:hypothetical protein